MSFHGFAPTGIILARDERLEFIHGRFVERVLGGKIHSEC